MLVVALLALLVMILAGCAIERNGVVHHVVIGFGIVSVPKTNDVAQVTRVRSFGVYGGNLVGPSCAVGYLSSTIVVVKTNVILEIK
jgi:hypothetical protein